MFPVSDVIPSRTTPYVTIAIIALSTAVFIGELSIGDALPRLISTFGLVPAFLFWPSVVTSMFLHAGWLHFLGSMLYLWLFGENVEDRAGHARYGVFYLLCGAVAAIAHVSFYPHSTVPVVGASGAVSGVMGAYFVFYPQSRVLTAVLLIVSVDVIEVPAVFFLGVWFVLQLFSGVGSLGVRAEAGVAVWGHIAAFAFGALVALVWRVVEGNRRRGEREKGEKLLF